MIYGSRLLPILTAALAKQHRRRALQRAAPIAAKKPRMTDFKPSVGRKRRSGTGCITEIDDHLFERYYFPKWPDGKKHERNVYAHTREECEEKLKVLIEEMKTEIAEAKRLMDLDKGNGRPLEEKKDKREGEKSRRWTILILSNSVG